MELGKSSASIFHARCLIFLCWVLYFFLSLAAINSSRQHTLTFLMHAKSIYSNGFIWANALIASAERKTLWPEESQEAVKLAALFRIDPNFAPIKSLSNAPFWFLPFPKDHE